jgi:hypothetical protein
MSLSVVLPILAVCIGLLLRTASGTMRRVRSCRWCGCGIDMESRSAFCSDTCDHSYCAMREQLMDFPKAV